MQCCVMLKYLEMIFYHKKKMNYTYLKKIIFAMNQSSELCLIFLPNV